MPKPDENCARLVGVVEKVIAFVGLKAVYADLGDNEKCRELKAFFDDLSIPMDKRQAELAAQRRSLPDQFTDNLHKHMCATIKSFRPTLKIAYNEGSVSAYVLSLLLLNEVESMPFKADISDEASLEKGVRAAMADLAPLAEEYKIRR